MALRFADFDADVRPQDDLFRHVNGTWLATAKIADHLPLAGSFIDLREAAEEAVREIVTGLGVSAGDDGAERSGEAAQIAALYASFMDTERIEAAGAQPLAEPLARIDTLTDIDQLPAYLGTSTRRGTGQLIDLGVDADPGEPTRYALFVGQGGLGLPDEEYYRLPEHADVLAKYRAHVETMLALAGFADASAQADAVVALETEIAKCHWDKVRTRDMVAMFNPTTAAELAASAPALDWPAFAAAAGVGHVTDLISTQPSFLTDVAKLFTVDRLDAWKSWARWHAVRRLARYLSDAFVDADFAFYGTVMSGTLTIKERWKRGVALVEGALGEAVGKLYVERHFSPVAKARMDELVANLIAAYRASIGRLDWMTEATRTQALEKLSKFRPKIGYPAKWRDYSGLEVGDDLLANVLASNEFDFDFAVGRLAGPMDLDEWFMTPQTVNAYYHPLRNEIVFPAAILQPPFFDEDADDALNYGGIGAVIGHEIGHGFDDQGSTCDGDGRLRDWWTAADREAFERRTKALVDQYEGLEPAETPGFGVNGQLTIGENIGDLGGLGIAYLAWQIAVGDDVPAGADGYTAAQRLFLSYAAVWQAKSRPETMRLRLATDPHSPAEFRCNQVIRNVDAFYAAFGVGPGDRLWLDPADRVKIW